MEISLTHVSFRNCGENLNHWSGLLFYFKKIEAVKRQFPDLDWMKEYLPESEAVRSLMNSIQSAASQLSLPEKVFCESL